jgi:anhydro-N-acetylmuramic acid kinase
MAKTKPKAMVVAGVMSGTSADGVDVAVCRIAPGLREGDSPRVKLLGMVGAAYPKALRAEVLRVMEGGAVTTAELSRLNWRLGEVYADAVVKACMEWGVGTTAVARSRDTPPFAMKLQRMGHPRSVGRLELVGMHGQTVHHEPIGRKVLGTVLRSTWQIGEAAVVAERLRCPVVSDFRPADLAAGGQGAPLVPMLDWCLFRSAKVSRVLQNLGGIGNLTALSAGCVADGVIAFDTGPGNMVIDGCMATLFGKKFDRNGAVAQRGRVLREVVARVLSEPYFSAPPPKSCGREEFGAAFTARFIRMCRDAGANDADCVATATALTAGSVLDAYRRFVAEHFGSVAFEPMSQKRDMGHPKAGKVEFCVAGGGVKNRTLMGMLREGFGSLGVRLREMEELGVPAQAKEAVAFALLAWLTWHGMAGNVPAATGASRGVVLGKVSYG